LPVRSAGGDQGALKAIAEFKVVICGAGIAGVEGLLRLRRLAGDSVDVTLLSPEDELVCRPLAVLEPFAPTRPSRYRLERIIADTQAAWVRDRLVRVDAQERIAHTGHGDELPFDALLVALGARESSPYEHAQLFSDRGAAERFESIVQEIDAGQTASIAFVLPDWPVWPIPLYELALLTAAHARRAGREMTITFVTPEARPLKVFGQAAGETAERLLADAGIDLYTGVVARVPEPQRLTFGEHELEAQRIVTVPRITGPAVPGLPAGTSWFVPIDERCRVLDTDGRVFAAGDVTDFPVKHGGIGAEQADTAAAGIAYLAGAAERPPPFEPLIRGTLLTGERPLYLLARVVEGIGWRTELYGRPPWPAEHKVAAAELGPYLNALDAAS
jgi:sulfide:quinone oxidoreductase